VEVHDGLNNVRVEFNSGRLQPADRLQRVTVYQTSSDFHQHSVFVGLQGTADTYFYIKENVYQALVKIESSADGGKTWEPSEAKLGANSKFGSLVKVTVLSEATTGAGHFLDARVYFYYEAKVTGFISDSPGPFGYRLVNESNGKGSAHYAAFSTFGEAHPDYGWHSDGFKPYGFVTCTVHTNLDGRQFLFDVTNQRYLTFIDRDHSPNHASWPIGSNSFWAIWSESRNNPVSLEKADVAIGKNRYYLKTSLGTYLHPEVATPQDVVPNGFWVAWAPTRQAALALEVSDQLVQQFISF
jgi:hypothetical protein